MTTFEQFQESFFGIFTQRQFRNVDFLEYLERPSPRRGGDEASIVDNTIVGPLLSLLGFGPGDQTYNQNNKNGRPDFAPQDSGYGVCFIVENKSTALELTTGLTRFRQSSFPIVRLYSLQWFTRGMADKRQGGS